MRIGYLIDTNVAGHRDAGAAMDAMVKEGRLAEQAGFHSVHAPDRHRGHACVFPGPEQLLTLLARETSRVMLGSFTHVATLVHPMKALEQFAVIDQLSRGRLVTTVSRGFLSQYWGQFGVPEERLLGRFKETLAIWRQARTGERFDFDGEFWRVRDGRLSPPPAQPGGWPLWGGGNKVPAAIRRSAEYGDAWTCDPMPVTWDRFDRDVALYRSRALELAKTPFVVLMQDGWVAGTEAEAVAIFGEHYERMAGFYLANDNAARVPAHLGTGLADSREVVSHALVGTPERVLERLIEVHEHHGVDYVVFCCRLSTGPPAAAVAEQILRFGEQVVQPVHARYPAPDHPAIPAACRW